MDVSIYWLLAAGVAVALAPVGVIALLLQFRNKFFIPMAFRIFAEAIKASLNAAWSIDLTGSVNR